MEDDKIGSKFGFSSTSGFGTESSSSSQSESSTSTASSTSSSSSTETTASNPSAIIGSKIRIKGELIGEEDLLIQGHVEGTIDLKDNILTIGKEGVLKANASAKIITIEGDVEGDLFGQERIVIRESSNVRGNLVADRVSLEDGAKFRGSIDMDVDAKNPDLLKPKFSEFAKSSDTAGSASTPASNTPAAASSSDKDTGGNAGSNANADKDKNSSKSGHNQKNKPKTPA